MSNLNRMRNKVQIKSLTDFFTCNSSLLILSFTQLLDFNDLVKDERGLLVLLCFYQKIVFIKGRKRNNARVTPS